MARGQHALAPECDERFERFDGIAGHVERAVEGDGHRASGGNELRDALGVHGPVGTQDAQHDSVGARFPRDFDALLSLPGIGRSTAGAIASFCFRQPRPVLDGNVKRVLRRWHDQPEATDKELWLLAQQALDGAADPALWNQAMMELGATICGAKSADCNSCPVSEACISAWQVDTAVEKQATVAVIDLHWQVALHLCPQKGIWLSQRPQTGIWAGLWTPPITELNDAPAKAPTHVHLLTHRRLHLYGELADGAPSGTGQWVDDISQLALPTGIHRLLEKQRSV